MPCFDGTLMNDAFSRRGVVLSEMCGYHGCNVAGGIDMMAFYERLE